MEDFPGLAHDLMLDEAWEDGERTRNIPVENLIGGPAFRSSDAVVARVKLFSPYNGWRWYITEWDPETGLCFGLVEGFETELGYFDLTELSEVTVFGGVPAVERDLYWQPQTLGEIRRESSGMAA